jgi:hypothetical protein
MAEVADTQKYLSDAEQRALGAVSDAQRIVVLKKMADGRSGDKVLLVDVHGKRHDQPAGLHVAKISHTLNKEGSGATEHERFSKAKNTSLGSYMPELRSISAEIDGFTVALYGIAQGTLFKASALAELVSNIRELDTARVDVCIGELATALQEWNLFDIQTRSAQITYLTPLEQINMALGKRRISDIEARIQSVLGINRLPTTIRFARGIELPNPLAYLFKENLWANPHPLPCPVGRIHGDLHSGNIFFHDTVSTRPSFIDFADYDPSGLIFTDWTYLELDLLLRLLPLSDEQSGQEWLRLTEYFGEEIQPTGIPRGAVAQTISQILQSLRTTVSTLCRGANEESFNLSFWTSGVATGLNYARKGLSPDQGRRAAAFLYSARALERLLAIMGISIYDEVSPFNISLRHLGKSDLLPTVNGIQYVILYSEVDGGKFARQIHRDLSSRGIEANLESRDEKPSSSSLTQRYLNSTQRLLVVATYSAMTSREILHICTQALDRNQSVFLLLPEEYNLPQSLQRLDVFNFHFDYQSALAGLLERLSTPDSGGAELSYLDAVSHNYARWRDLYTPMAGVASIIASESLMFAVNPTDIDPRYELLDKQIDLISDKLTKQEVFDDIREAVNYLQRVIVLGAPGTGKTTTLRTLAEQYARAARSDPSAPIPIYLELSAYTGPEDFVTHLRMHLGELAPFPLCL